MEDKVMSKIIVSYFSASGTTEKVALKIAKAIEGDVFKIDPVQEYTEWDLDWTDKQSRSSKEMKDKSSRPAIKEKVSNLDNYDIVVIGFPVWWFTAPTIINTFIEENNLEGKKIYIFVTSGGSKANGCLKDLRNAYQNLEFVDGKRFIGNESDEEIKEWIK